MSYLRKTTTQPYCILEARIDWLIPTMDDNQIFQEANEFRFGVDFDRTHPISQSHVSDAGQGAQENSRWPSKRCSCVSFLEGTEL